MSERQFIRHPHPGVSAPGLIAGDRADPAVEIAPSEWHRRSPLVSVVKSPLVSVVIINWNYARYIGATIASVKRQDYPNFECLIVDNASTDDSVEVISQAIKGDARFRLLRLPENYGHLGASLKVLDELKGQFVNFLDADDILFDNFLSSHVQVHLVSTAPVPFTSSDVITIDANNEVISGRLYTLDEESRISLSKCLPPSRTLALPTISDADYRLLRGVTYDVPTALSGWCWSPGSANVIRREMLRALAVDVIAPLLGGVDGYFLLPLFAMSGTNIIGRPLSAYRVHGSNDHTRMPQLRGIRNGNEGAYVRNSAVKRLSVVTLLTRTEKMLQIINPPTRYFRVLEIVAKNAVDSVFIEKSLFQSSEVRQAAAAAYPVLVKVFGERTVIRELRSLMKLKYLLAILVSVYNRRIPFATFRRLCIVGLRRQRQPSERGSARAMRRARS